MKPRLTPAELDARLKFVIGCILGFVLLITTVGDKNNNGIPDNEE